MAKNSYTIVAATLEHVHALRGRLRTSDILEIEASSGRDPDEALELSWRASDQVWAALQNDRVIALFGAGRISMLSDIGVPWMLGSEELTGAGLEVGKRSRQYVLEMKNRFSLLENYIDARQKTSIRWLKWLGFQVEPAQPWGVLQLPFHRFFMD